MSQSASSISSKLGTEKKVYSLLASVAVVSLVLALFDVWVGTKGTKAPSWAFVVLAILGALGIAAAIFRVASVPRELAMVVVPVLVAALYFYIGTSTTKSPKWAFTTLTVVGFVKGISALAVLVFALSYNSSIKSS
jgi:hypothetical protein